MRTEQFSIEGVKSNQAIILVLIYLQFEMGRVQYYNWQVNNAG